MNQFFYYYSHQSHSNNEPINLNTHTLKIIKKSHGVLFCTFKELCEADRSHKDYLDLANQFHTVLIDDLRQISAHDHKTILRFIHLIDIFYDQHVRLILLAEIALNDIYPQGPHHTEFQRTQSRLIEMQSAHYVDQADSII
jgi:cell division protein ZapE